MSSDDLVDWLIGVAKRGIEEADDDNKIKIEWAKILVSLITKGKAEVSREDLATILSEIPEKEAKKFLKRLQRGARYHQAVRFPSS